MFRKQTLLSKKVLIPSALIVVAIIFVVLELSHTTNMLKTTDTAKDLATASQETKGESDESSESTSTQGSNNSNGEPGDTKSSTGGDATSTSLLPPTGNFVSTHRTSLSNADGSGRITSVCNTTPGANCTISFTKDGVVKTLAAQNTDRGGTTYWNNWSPADYGLTEGGWKITAKTTLGGNTQAAEDVMELLVVR
jgi:hypothetical protein